MNSIASPRRVAGALFAGCSLLLAAAPLTPAAAQTPIAGQPADPLKDAFDALPEAERHAIQDALVWTGDYKGTIDGVLGRGGIAALAAYARRANTTPEGALEPARRKQLLAEAQKLRVAVRFTSVQDARSGAAVALPAAIFTRRTDTPTGARWTNAAGSASVETFSAAGGDLPGLYETQRAPAPGRKVTYSVLRPEFFVVAGEDQRGVFYTRAARGEVNGAAFTRGYTLVYARTLQPSFGAFAIAISNGFRPFPSPSAPAQVAAPDEAARVSPPGPRRVI